MIKPTQDIAPLDTDTESQRVFLRQREAYQQEPYISYSQRKELLNKVERIILDNADEITQAINTDYGCRSVTETKFLEIFTSVDGIRHSKKHMRKWMKQQRRHVPLLYATAKNRVIPQPKGIVGIVAPWNYPLFLVMSPLANAVAAGNRCMVKLASNSSNLCALLAEKFAEQISQEYIAILPGVKASEFSSLAFDHLCFTGSANTGKTVMRSAADNLTPLTLELGGKSPTIVCDDFDLEVAAQRILYAKYLNAGQTCLAPDYLFLPEGKEHDFISLAKKIVSHRYPSLNDDYTSVIDNKAFSRLQETMLDAQSKGATLVNLVEGLSADSNQRKIPPILIVNPTDEMTVMQEEIFGPILPIKTYKNIDEVLTYINERDRPLALYLFTNNRETEQRVIYNTMSGGVTINNCLLHVSQHDMPFGGSGTSGMGQYHGYEGFLEFSKLRSVFTQPKLSGLHLLYPPYTDVHTKIYKTLIRLFR